MDLSREVIDISSVPRRKSSSGSSKYINLLASPQQHTKDKVKPSRSCSYSNHSTGSSNFIDLESSPVPKRPRHSQRSVHAGKDEVIITCEVIKSPADSMDAAITSYSAGAKETQHSLQRNKGKTRVSGHSSLQGRRSPQHIDTVLSESSVKGSCEGRYSGGVADGHLTDTSMSYYHEPSPLEMLQSYPRIGIREQGEQYNYSGFPLYWTTCVQCTNRCTSRYHVLSVNSSSTEFSKVTQRFGTGYEVRKVYRIQNDHLWKRYKSEKQLLLNDASEGYKLNEAWLFHSTRASLQDICEEGLDPRLSRTGNFGRGTYFSDDPLKCHSYGVSKNSVFSILVCRVLLGDIKEYHQGQSDSSLIREPLKFNPRPGEKKSFDSVMGNITGQREHVIYNPYRALPEYIVEYCYHQHRATGHQRVSRHPIALHPCGPSTQQALATGHQQQIGGYSTYQPPPSGYSPYQPPPSGYSPYQPPPSGYSPYQPPPSGYSTYQPPPSGYSPYQPPPTSGYPPISSGYHPPSSGFPLPTSGNAPPPAGQHQSSALPPPIQSMQTSGHRAAPNQSWSSLSMSQKVKMAKSHKQSVYKNH